MDEVNTSICIVFNNQPVLNVNECALDKYRCKMHALIVKHLTE